MKNRVILAACSGVMLAFASQSALATHHHLESSLPMSKILKDLDHKGYHAIREVEFQNGVYQVKAMNAQGAKIKLNVDPKTGAITTNSTEENNRISMLQATQKVEAAGYHGVYEVEAKHGKYEIKALDKNEKKVKLQVCAKTGVIKKEGLF